MRTTTPDPPRPWLVALVADYLGGATVVVAGLLLTSIAGAAVIAAPVTMPLLVATSLFGRHRWMRWAAAIVAGLTVFEATWAGISLASRNAGIGPAAAIVVGASATIGLRALARLADRSELDHASRPG